MDFYSTLVAELQSDPLARGYPGTSDAQRLASLTSPDRTRSRRVGSLELLVWGGLGGRLAKVRRAANALDPYQSIGIPGQSAAIAADAMMSRPDSGFDRSSAAQVAIVDALVASGVLSAEDKASLLALAVEPCSRADELGLSGLDAGHLVSARQLMGG